MYFVYPVPEALVEDMGFALSRLDVDSGLLDGSSRANSEVARMAQHDGHLHSLDHEIAQLTRLRSKPNENLSKVLGVKKDVPVSIVKMLVGRESNYSGRGSFSSADRCHVLSRYLPVNSPCVVDQMPTRAYVSQFSADGSLFISAFQGSHIRIYNVEKDWKIQKDIQAQSLRWTVTDTSLSPDHRHLVYATMSPIVHVVNVGSGTTESVANVTEIHEGLDFSSDDDNGYSFGIFSVKHSTDGREIVAGSSDDAIYVYDLEANKLSLRISAHGSDVNTVCFADDSGNLIYSGSDDNLCKVWDRRCIRTQGKSEGVLMGHLEGITCVDSRRDGRYLISNGKDQAIKLWDIRKMSSNATCTGCFRNYEWDYRWMDYPPQARYLKHPSDQSVGTYKGHAVLRTLIRCYFSPAYSTAQKYIYTGSHDKCVYVYDLVSGAQVAKLKHHRSTVRDCSWHPHYPMLVSSSWDGDIVKWEFGENGEVTTPAKRKQPRRR
nr:LEC14B protein [Ipomoea batatas]